MTGLDFSAASLAQARRLAAAAGADVRFVESDVYEADHRLGHDAFDLVYTGIGALCWLPDVRRWAGVVAALLRPGGRLFLREGHPMLWALDDERTDGLLVVDYPYFERADPTVFHDAGTYVQTEQTFVATETHTWNHGLAETLTALLDAGLRITQFVEHESVPWDALPGQMERLDSKEWRLRDRPWRLAHSYTMEAVKPR
jgi:SAM-dependent methyltransferase